MNYRDLIKSLTNQINFDDMQQARPVAPNERPSRGIDPRDPNQYSVLPDGSLMSTLIGWSPNGGRNIEDLIGAISGKRQLGLPPQGNTGAAASNRIPRANKNGLTRLSPGVYRDQKGKLVNKMRG